MPFFGQVNLLTTSSFDAPQDLFSDARVPGSQHRQRAARRAGRRSRRLDGPRRGHAGRHRVVGRVWRLRDARTGPPRYDVGLSYSTQRYDGGNFAALRNVTDGSRNVGTLHGVRHVRRHAGHLGDLRRALRPLRLSRRQEPAEPARRRSTFTPADHLRVNALVSIRALAPGAEEFMPPADTGIWLPPQRTFSSLRRRARSSPSGPGTSRPDSSATSPPAPRFRCARSASTSTNQLVTLFGIEEPGRRRRRLDTTSWPTAVAVDATGYSAGLKAVIAERVHGSVEYSFARAERNPLDNPTYLRASRTVRAPDGRASEFTT